MEPRHKPARGAPRVVVGVGESEAGAAALAWAHDLCRGRGWLLDVVTAWPDVGEVAVHEIPGHYCVPRGRAVAALQAALAACGLEIGGPLVRVYVENAEPVQTLVDHSRGARLLVLGRSGSGRSRCAGHRSVSDLCRVQASCPVVVIDGEHDRPLRTA